MKKQFLSLVILMFCVTVTAQSVSKADKLFKRRSYVEAAEIYSKIALKKPSKEVYEKLADSYFFNSKMREAATWYGKLVDKYPNEVNATNAFRYIQTLKSLKEYEKIDAFTRSHNDISLTAQLDPTKTVDVVKKLSQQVIKNINVDNLESNSGNSDFAPAFYNDKIVFASPSKTSKKTYDWNQQPYLDLFVVNIDENGKAGKAESFSEILNTDKHEAFVTFSNDGKTIYFSRNSTKKGKDKDKGKQLKIYKANLVSGAWQNVTELPFSSNEYSVTHPALSPDNKTLYFSSDMPGTNGGFDIYKVAINNDGSFGEPQNLGSQINTDKREQFPFVASNGDLYLASDGHAGIGGLDIFKVVEGTPKNMGLPFNSSMDDFSYIINEQEQVGYFASNREGGKGDDDIYRFNIESIVLFGKVLDKTSGELIPGANVRLLDSEGNTIFDKNVGEKAYYEVELEPNKSYVLKGSKDLYNPSEIAFETDYKGDLNKDVILELITYVEAAPEVEIIDEKPQIALNPIYFDFNKWNIRPDAARELETVVSVMKQFPEMVVAIGSHTDSRGKDDYNMRLSQKRAKSTYDYIVSRGINPSNLSYQGYGESQLRVNCGNNCTEQDHDLNRRSEFVLVK